MQKVKLATLLLGAALFTGIGATSLAAEGDKCGSAKCGGEKKEMKSDGGKCGGDKKTTGGDDKAKNGGKCGGEKKSMKCGTGKCG